MITTSRLTCIAAMLAFGSMAAIAQDAKPAKAAAKSTQSAAKKPAEPMTPIEAALAAASSDQMVAADRVLVGRSDCEFGQYITVAPNANNTGYFDLSMGSKRWLVKPIISSTGALRMEDVHGKALLLQIANKSMLMDTAAGNRLADNCVHPKQREAMAAHEGQSQGLLQSQPSK